MNGIKSVLKKFWRRWWHVINIVLTLVYIIWRACFTIPVEYGIVSLVAGILLFAVEFIGMFEAWIHYYNMNEIENPELPEVPYEKFPHVDIFVATYSESTKLLYKTLNGCKNMDYPNKSKVHIYLCDDNRRPEMQKLAADMGVNYLKRDSNEHAKAGNLNHAMGVTDSPLVVTFDADMIPTHDFLMKTVPYFVDADLKNEGKEEKDKKKMGFVQTPQSFYNTDLFQFNLFSEDRIPNEQDYFYKDVQVARNKSNSVIYGGSNTVLSRAAIEDIGGFFTDAITEDFATGLCLQKKGYICYAINEVLASGLSPTDLKNLIQQRIRWARGVIATGKKLHIIKSKELSLAQKLNYLSSILYWYVPIKRFVYIMSPIMFAAFGYMVIKCTLPEVLLFWLPMYISSNLTLKMFSGNIRTTKWTAIYEVILFPFMLIPVFLETLGISLKKFKVTEKTDDQEFDKAGNLLYMIPFVLFIVFSIVGIANSIKLMLLSGSVDVIVVLFWLINNMFGLVMALFFVSGRAIYRKSERVTASEKIVIFDGIYETAGYTKDMSEGGISVTLTEPMDYDDLEEIEMEIKSERHPVSLKGKITNVVKIKKNWRYAFTISDYNDQYDEYLNVLYDRVPTLPQNLASNSGMFDDLKTNLERRLHKPFYENRKMARVPLSEILKDEKGTKYEIINFNYKFLAVHTESSQERVVLALNKEIKFACTFRRNLPTGGKLYSIDNYGENHKNAKKRKAIDKWVHESLERAENAKELKQKQQKPVEKKKDFSEMDHF